MLLLCAACRHSGPEGGHGSRHASTLQSVTKLDRALDRIVSFNAQVEVLKDSLFTLAEGPLWIDEAGGYLLFSDIPANVIYKWSPNGALSVHLARSGYTGSEAPVGGAAGSSGRAPGGSSGSNGLTLDHEKRLVLCATGDRAVVRIEKDGSRTTVVDRYEGKRLNRPNDLVIRSDGHIYFTDPPSPNGELGFGGVFAWRDGKLELLERGLRAPNGLAFSPDERILYVSSYADRTVFRYDVRTDGSLANRRVFIDMTADSSDAGPDGMKVDRHGYLYATGPGGVWIVSPEGKHLGTIRVSGVATNVAFGDRDSRTLYITTRRSLARVRLLTAGIRP